MSPTMSSAGVDSLTQKEFVRRALLIAKRLGSVTTDEDCIGPNGWGVDVEFRASNQDRLFIHYVLAVPAKREPYEHVAVQSYRQLYAFDLPCVSKKIIKGSVVTALNDYFRLSEKLLPYLPRVRQ